MPRPPKLSGPIGRGWIETEDSPEGKVYVAKWQRYVPDSTAPSGKKKAWGGKHVLGRVARRKSDRGFTSEKAALEHWCGICQDIMNGREAAQSPAPRRDVGQPDRKKKYTFEQYCEEVWIPARSQRWNDDTRDGILELYFRGTLDRKTVLYKPGYVYKKFGNTPIADIRGSDIQDWLEWLAKKGKHPEQEIGYSKTVVSHCKYYVELPLQHAAESRVIDVDPTINLFMPKVTRKVHKPQLKLKHLVLLVEALPTAKDEIMAELLYFAGLAPG